MTEPSAQAQQDAVEWMTLWPLDKPEPRVQSGTRWRYFRSTWNGPTLTGILIGSRFEPWLAKYVT